MVYKENVTHSVDMVQWVVLIEVQSRKSSSHLAPFQSPMFAGLVLHNGIVVRAKDADLCAHHQQQHHS